MILKYLHEKVRKTYEKVRKKHNNLLAVLRKHQARIQ